MDFTVLIWRIDDTDRSRARAYGVITELKARRTVRLADVGLWRVPVFDKQRGEALDLIRSSLTTSTPAGPRCCRSDRGHRVHFVGARRCLPSGLLIAANKTSHPPPDLDLPLSA